MASVILHSDVRYDLPIVDKTIATTPESAFALTHSPAWTFRPSMQGIRLRERLMRLMLMRVMVSWKVCLGNTRQNDNCLEFVRAALIRRAQIPNRISKKFVDDGFPGSRENH
jgi:hypothetical protein